MKIEPFNYDLDTAPPAYACHACGLHGAKLWRESHVSAVELRCVACVGGASHDVLAESDQINGHVPAVPAEDGDGWWGYSSVPQAGCEWWYRLPCDAVVRAGRKAMTAAEARAVDARIARERDEQRARDAAEIDANCAGARAVVMVEHGDDTALWSAWHQRVTWDHISLGSWCRIGDPVIGLSTSFARVAGVLVAFVEVTSEHHDAAEIDRWIGTTFPTAARLTVATFGDVAAMAVPR